MRVDAQSGPVAPHDEEEREATKVVVISGVVGIVKRAKAIVQ